MLLALKAAKKDPSAPLISAALQASAAADASALLLPWNCAYVEEASLALVVAGIKAAGTRRGHLRQLWFGRLQDRIWGCTGCGEWIVNNGSVLWDDTRGLVCEPV